MKKSWRWLISLAACSTYLVAVAMPAHAATTTTVQLPSRFNGTSSTTFTESPDCGPNPTGTVAWHFVLNQLDDGTAPGTLTASFQTSGTKTATGAPVGNGQTQHFYVYTDSDDTLLGASATVDQQTGTPDLVLSHVAHGCVPISGGSGGSTGGDTGGSTTPPVTCDAGQTAVDTNNDGIADTCQTDTSGGDTGGSVSGGDTGSGNTGGTDITCDAGMTAVDTDADGVLDACVPADNGGGVTDGSGSGDGGSSAITCAEGQTAVDTDANGVADTCVANTGDGGSTGSDNSGSNSGSDTSGSGTVGSGDTGNTSGDGGTQSDSGSTNTGGTGSGNTDTGSVDTGSTGSDSGSVGATNDTTGGESAGAVATGDHLHDRLQVLGVQVSATGLAKTGSNTPMLLIVAMMLLALGVTLRGFGSRRVRPALPMHGSAAIAIARLGASIVRTPARSESRHRKRP